MSVQFDCLSALKTELNIFVLSVDKVIKWQMVYEGTPSDPMTTTVSSGTYNVAEFITEIETKMNASLNIAVPGAVETIWLAYSDYTFMISWTDETENYTLKYTDTDSTLGDIIGLTADQEGEEVISDSKAQPKFLFIDYLTAKNIEKIGNRFPAILIEDVSEEWKEGGSKRFEVYHTVRVFLYENINQSRIETLLTDQTIITGLINANVTLSGNADCVQITSIEKGESYYGKINFQAAGYNDNISIRIINLLIREQIT